MMERERSLAVEAEVAELLEGRRPTSAEGRRDAAMSRRLEQSGETSRMERERGSWRSEEVLDHCCWRPRVAARRAERPMRVRPVDPWELLMEQTVSAVLLM